MQSQGSNPSVFCKGNYLLKKSIDTFTFIKYEVNSRMRVKICSCFSRNIYYIAESLWWNLKNGWFFFYSIPRDASYFPRVLNPKYAVFKVIYALSIFWKCIPLHRKDLKVHCTVLAIIIKIFSSLQKKNGWSYAKIKPQEGLRDKFSRGKAAIHWQKSSFDKYNQDSYFLHATNSFAGPRPSLLLLVHGKSIFYSFCYPMAFTS